MKHDIFKYFHNNFRWNKTKISASLWPHDGLWPEMVEDYQVTYKSQTLDALGYISYFIDGPNCNQNNNFFESKDDLEDYRRKNFMKV